MIAWASRPRQALASAQSEAQREAARDSVISKVIEMFDETRCE